MATRVDLTIPPALRPFLGIGTVAIVAGGIAASVTRPIGWDHGSWVAAFLVLVPGVGQIGLGIGQAILAEPPPSPRRLATQVGLVNAAAALVIAGTLTSTPAVVTGGGLALVGALATFGRPPPRRTHRRTWPVRAYTAVLLVLILSTPVGLALAWLRA
jgi:hypothetical protein